MQILIGTWHVNAQEVQVPGNALPAMTEAERTELLKKRPIPIEYNEEGRNKQFEEFRLAFEEAQGALHSIHVKYRFWNESMPDGDKTAPLREWALQGRQYLSRCETPHHVGGLFDSASWVSFDGEYGYAINYWESDPTVPYYVYRSREVPEEARKDSLLSMIFMKKSTSGSPSPLELLRKCRNPVLPLASPPQYPEFRISVELPLTREGQATQNTMIMMFRDPKVGWPVKINVQPTRFSTASVPLDENTLKHQDGDIVLGFEYLDFHNVDDQILGSQRPFPKRIRYETLLGPSIVILDEVLINHSLPKSMFIPKLPIGVEVISDPQTPLQKSEITGGVAGQKQFQERLSRFRKKDVMAASQSVNAIGGVIATPNKSNMSKWIWGFVVASAIASAWIWRRS